MVGNLRMVGMTIPPFFELGNSQREAFSSQVRFQGKTNANADLLA
jgi:hypothetical protein